MAITTDFTITADTTFKAVYEIKRFKVTPSTGANGTISPSTVQTVDYGSSCSFTFTANTGYEIDKVLVNGAAVSVSGTSYTISNITKDTTIAVSYKLKKYKVTPSVTGTGGTISPNTVQTVNHGDSCTFTFTPSANYEIDKVLVNGAAVTPTGNKYTISNITKDTTISVSFKLPGYTVKFIDHDGAVLKTETVQHGGTATPPADPVREGYTFTGWQKQ